MSLKPAWLTALLALAGCGPSQSAETITLGAVLSKTGAQAFSGVESIQAANLAISEINAAGGVLGKQLKLYDADDGSERAIAKTAAEAMVAAKVPVVYGALVSALSLEAQSVLEPAKIVMISGSSTSVLLSKKDDYFFRTCTSDAVQSKILAQRARNRSPAFSRIAVLYIDDGAYGPGLANDFKLEFERLGGTVTINEKFTAGQNSYLTTLNTVLATNPEAILLIAYPEDGGQIIKDYLNAPPPSGVFWYFSDGVVDPSFVATVGATRFTFPHEGTAGSNTVGPRYDAYKAAFKAKYGTDATPGSYSANTYDAVYLTALAMTAGQAATADAVKANLPAVSKGGTAYDPSQFKQAVEALKAGGDVNFEGASGSVDFDEYGNVAAPFDVWKVVDGTITVTQPNVFPSGG